MTPQLEALYPRAVEIVRLDGKASTSYIQRRLQIGYNAAAELIERMEKDGVVSPANHVGKREILPLSHPALQAMAEDAGMAKPAAPALPLTTPYACSGCDTGGMGTESDLPAGWYMQNSAAFGQMPRCPSCAAKNAVRIATSTMTTEEILSADTSSIDSSDVITGAAQTRLKSYVERFNRLLDDMEALRGDIKEVGLEAKGEGFDVKIILKVVRESRKDKHKRDEEAALFDLYASAAGLDL